MRRTKNHMSNSSGTLICPQPTSPEQYEQWKKLRRTGIGASEIAAAMGISPYQSTLNLWMVKRGLAAEFEGNPATRWGTLKEDMVCQFFANETGLELEPGGLWRSDLLDWQLATPDRGVVGLPEWVEAKCVNARVESMNWDKGVPLYVYAQCQQQIDATGRERVHVVAELGGNPPKWWTVERDDVFIAAMRVAGDKFWWHVQTGTMPEPDGASAADLLAAYPIEPGTSVELDFEGEVAYYEYIEARESMKPAQARKAAAGAVLREKLGQKQRAVLNGKPVVKYSNEDPNRQKFDYNTFAEEEPDMLAYYMIDAGPATPKLIVT